MFSSTRAATPSPSRTRPEEQVLRADVVVVEPLRLVLRQRQDLACAVRELVEAIHRVERLFPSRASRVRRSRHASTVPQGKWPIRRVAVSTRVNAAGARADPCRDGKESQRPAGSGGSSVAAKGRDQPFVFASMVSSAISTTSSVAAASMAASSSATVSAISAIASRRGGFLCGLVGGDGLDDLLDRLGGLRFLGLLGGRDGLDDLDGRPRSAASSLASLAAAASSRRSISSAAAVSSTASSAATSSTISWIGVGGDGLLGRLVAGDGLDDLLDRLGGRGLLDVLVGGDLVTQLVHLGGGELLADLGERRGEGVVDAALRLLDRVRHRVAAVGARPALGARRHRVHSARRPGGPAAPRPA